MLELVSWTLIWAIFKRPARFHWLLLPAFIALPVELYLQTYYSQGISTHHIGIIAETSPREALEFLGNRTWLLAAAMLAVLAWWVLSWKAALATRDLDMGKHWRAVTLVLLVLILCAWLYQRGNGVRSATGDADDSVSAATSGKPTPWFPGLPRWAELPVERDTFGATWPFGLVVHIHAFWKERQYLAQLADRSGGFKFGASQAGASDLPQVVVMVIGESSRHDRWSLNGYQRETNPLLKDEPNLVSLSNVVTAVSATRLSVPVLVSRKPAMQSLKAGFSEKSFLSAFREAGFKTYWLSNQMSFGQFDTPISVFAREADVTQFLNLGGFTNGSSFDAVLLDPLKVAIDDPASKKLIVLHTLGNHWNYSHRYPQEFDKWQPSLFGIDKPAYTEAALKPQLNNSYDNSILYTDWFLSQVIGALKSSTRIASMMYVSDHGQTLYDGTCNLAFHGHNTQYEFHIPALVWYSDSYRQTHPTKITQLKKNRHAKLATENVFHSLLDMADIRYDSEQLEWSFLDGRFKQHKRYVDSYGWTDYDNAIFKGDCREVIDKGKPLPRSE
ncbi:phosphoethanolamine transferase [Noviherbaspirillum cavernae]|uniref:phosphoethanolamine transferase n=1 Tax=Noviherbaspirillum cavernae TaxID=2320862 RepID=UPI0030F4A6C7